MMLESNMWGENSFLFIHTACIGNDLLKIRKMNRAELILKIAYSSAITLPAILKTRSARRLARCLLPAFLCAHVIKRDVWVRGRIGTVLYPGNDNFKTGNMDKPSADYIIQI